MNWGWEWVFYTTGSLGLFWILWWAAVYRAPARQDALATPGETQKQIRWTSLLQYPTTWGVMFGQAGYLYIYYVFATWLPGYLVLQRGLSALATGWVGMLPFLIGTICVILGGWLGDRLIAAGRPVTWCAVSPAGAFGRDCSRSRRLHARRCLAIAFLTLSVASVSFSTRR